MVALDIIWLYMSSALVLTLIAISGFFIFKIGIYSFKLIFEDINTVKKMETHQIVSQKPSKAAEKLDARIKLVQTHLNKIHDKLEKMGKKGIKDPKYAYIQLFKK